MTPQQIIDDFMCDTKTWEGEYGVERVKEVMRSLLKYVEGECEKEKTVESIDNTVEEDILNEGLEEAIRKIREIKDSI